MATRRRPFRASPNFLAVKPGATFSFPFRIEELPDEPRDEHEQARIDALRGLDLAKLICGWLKTGLTERGAGAKTAAGYGYFTPVL